MSARSSRHSGADLSNNATESSYEWGGALHRAAPDPTLQRPPESRLRLSTVLGSDRPAHVPCAASAQEPRSEFASSQQAVASGEAPAEPPVHTNERFAGRAARDCFIATPAIEPVRLLRALPDAKQKPVRGVERQRDDRSWVDAEVLRAAIVWLLLLRCSSGAESGATQSKGKPGGPRMGSPRSLT